MKIPMDEPGHGPTFLLASGLSISKPNSFSRQLDLLGNELTRRGHSIIVTGRTTQPDSGDMPMPREQRRFDVPDYSDVTYSRLKAELGISRCVLIGYPDQFPFLAHHKMPGSVFFWYQCSRPVLPSGLDGATPIPLTRKTREFLNSAGCRRIGPVVPHGIDTELFKPAAGTQPLPLESGIPVICSVGANSTRKRFDLLLESFSHLLASEPDARLMIKTDSGSKPGGFHLRRMAEELGVLSRLTLIEGELPDEEMVGFYRKADCYVHTAEWEGFGIPVIEAMACGIPVVTHQVQGPGETVPYTAQG